MRLTNLPLNTLKEVPAEAETLSHQLMLRAGLIRRLASGLYSWLPIGMRILQKIENIIREEMNRAGALEVMMPIVQPAELWRESGRWEKFGPELLRLEDRHQRKFCLGPTHEEVITDIARHELKSYRQLPVNYYQIQTKFRDEIRPRFGVMRAREFTMKDAYSFHIDEESLLRDGYEVMRSTYDKIFTRLQLKFRIVQADPGAIGGNLSEEFQVLAESGEDKIAYCDADDFAANIEVIELEPPNKTRSLPTQTCEIIKTPKIQSIEALSKFFKVGPEKCLKTILVQGNKSPAVALLLRGDHELNATKAERIDAVMSPLRMLNATEIHKATGCEAGFLGPKELDISIYMDQDASLMSDFVCGANQTDYHYRGTNWGRDIEPPEIIDLRNATTGDPSPKGGGPLSIARGIEVAQIFQLGKDYSEALKATVLDDQGGKRTIEMGCYGIGVTRIVAATIEQNHDNRGIIWPEAIAPFDILIIPINLDKSYRVREAADTLYCSLIDAGLDVLMDDRSYRPGVKFADADLLGIPHRVVVTESAWDKGKVEYKNRREDDPQLVPLDRLVELLKDKGD